MFGVIAMTLIGSFKLERTQKGQTKKGSPAATKVVRTVMRGLGLR